MPSSMVPNLGLRFLFAKRASLSLEVARSQMKAGATNYLQTRPITAYNCNSPSSDHGEMPGYGLPENSE